MKQISMYFKSDFTVILASEGEWGGAPFRLKLWTASPAEGRSIKACFDGEVWHNCRLLDDGRLQISVNQGDLGERQYMGIGTLKMDIEFYLSNQDFNDHYCNEHIKTFEPVFVDTDGEEYKLYLDNQGASTLTTVGTLPAFYQAGLTPEEHQALINATVHAEEASNNANEQAGIATEAAQAADNARTALITAYNDKVAALDADYAAKKQALDADYANTKQSLTSDYATVKAQFDADYAQKKAQLAQDYATAIAGINDRMTAIESLYTTDKAEWQRQVDAILAKCVSDFETAEAQREARVNTAVQSATEATAQVNAAVQKASNVNAVLNGDNLTVTDQNGNAVTRNVRGPKGDSITMFPNVTIFGQPTIQESQISNFSADNYLQFPFVVDFAGRPWQIDCAITTGSNVSQQHNVLDSAFGLAFAFSGGKFVLALSSDGTSWNLGATSGTHTILANTTYYIRISWDGSVYKLAYSTDKETWVDDITVTSSASLASKQIIIGKSLDNRYIFNGSINMAEAHLTISGKIVWEGMDDAGLATRMAIDMSNIDEEGKQRVNQIVNDGEVGAKLSELEGKTKDISKQVIETEEEEIIIEDNSGNQVAKINSTGANFKNLKSNGKDVVTDISGKQDVITQISEVETDSNEDEITFTSDSYDNKTGAGEIYANINSNGISTKGIFDFHGNSVAKDYTQLFQASVKPSYSSGYKTKPLCIVHFSDIHNSANPLKRLISFAKAYGKFIDDVVNTGDSMADCSADFEGHEAGYGWYSNVQGSEKILNIIGNHDSALSGNKDGRWQYDWTGYGKVETYNKFIKPFIVNWNVVQPSNADDNGLSYYYKDYTDKKIRLIALDVMFYDDEQEVWFADTLNDAKTKGLSVLVIAHYPPKSYNGFDANYSSIDTNHVYNPASYNTRYTNAASIVQSFIDEGGDFICWLGGHEHTDIFGKLDAHPKQTVILVDTAQTKSADNAAITESSHIEGTGSQNAFNVVTIDVYSHLIKIFRVGAEYDRHLRKKGTICIDYKNVEVVSES